MEIPRQLITLGCAFGMVCSATSSVAEPPRPSPTPKPGTLAALAGSRPLHRAPGFDGAGAIVITDENLGPLGEGAALTVMTSTIAETGDFETKEQGDPKIREKWRRRVLAQGEAVARLQARRHDVQSEIDRLERGRLDSRTLDRLAKAESKLRVVDEEIKRAQTELSRIVRNARKEGAQPGWFR